MQPTRPRPPCDTGVPVGGGALSNSSSTVVNLNSTYPIPGGWRSYVNNAGAGQTALTPYVVCAG